MYWKKTQYITWLLAQAGIATLWAITAFAQPLERAGQSIDIVASVGFQQQIQLDKWTPVTVTVRNAGAAVTGHLEVIAADSQARVEYQTHYRQPLELAYGAQKRLHFTVFLSRITVPMQIRIVTDAGVVASHNEELHSKLSPQRFIATLGKDVNLDYLNDRDSYRTQVVYPLPGFLPTHWRGYDGVEAIILHRFSLQTLAPTQFSALTNWITAGGTLVVSGGYDSAILRTPRIAQLLPAQVSGTQQLHTNRALHRALGYGPDDDEKQPLTLTQAIGLVTVNIDNANLTNRATSTTAAPNTATPNSAEPTRTGHRMLPAGVVHHIDNVPLVLEHKYGRGNVVLLTFDIGAAPFQAWSGMPSFMKRMAKLSTVDPVTLQLHTTADQNRLSPLSRLARDGSLDYPNHATIIAFAAFYLAVVALCTREGYELALTKNRQYLLAFGIPVVFSVAAAALFHRILFPPTQSIASLTLIEPIDNSNAAQLHLQLRAHTTLADPLEIRYTGASPVMRTAVTPPNRRSASADPRVEPWIFQQGAVSIARPLVARPYTEFSISGSDVIDFAVSANYRQNTVVDFHNHSGRNITDLWAFTASHAFNPGSVTDNNSISVALNPATGMPLTRSTWRDQLSRQHRGGTATVAAINALLRGDFGDRFKQTTDAGVLLVGFTSNPWIITNTERHEHIDLSMVAWLLERPAHLKNTREHNSTQSTLRNEIQP